MKENKPIGLLAKWIPSMNTSSVYTRRRARELKNLCQVSVSIQINNTENYYLN